VPVGKVAYISVDRFCEVCRYGMELGLVDEDWGDESVDDGDCAVEGSVVVLPLDKSIFDSSDEGFPDCPRVNVEP